MTGRGPIAGVRAVRAGIKSDFPNPTPFRVRKVLEPIRATASRPIQGRLLPNEFSLIPGRMPLCSVNGLLHDGLPTL